MIFPTQRPAYFQKILPPIMPSWGKVRVANGGDRIRAAFAQQGQRGTSRDASYVRVSAILGINTYLP